MSVDIAAQIRSNLRSQGLPTPSVAWIQSAMPNRNPLPPLPALVATVKTRLLAADLTTPALFDHPTPSFPPNLGYPQVQETNLDHDVPVQVLDIESLSISKWEQVEEIESIMRGERTRGREIIRLPTRNEDDDNDNDGGVSESVPAAMQSATERNAAINATIAAAAATSSYGTHRLVLQDCKGQKIHGLELKRIERIGVGMLNIGEKMMLKRGTKVARGVILLEPTTCVILGGKVEAWQKAWIDGRLARLREAVGADARG